MRQLAVFTEPDDGEATLRHDNGIVTRGKPGEADGRPAQLIDLDETQYVEGHGAWLDLKWPDESTLSQHGALKFHTRSDGRAAFEADVFRKPTSF
jgi:regulatory protein YycH of two-component signal transduction system YycFG